ncbi:MAG: DUF2784 domain-containing protein [Planctomycetota bacterium]|nr:MAG: DUF2784 domain-containing protein [Planctomycetota bacterium]REJ90588.1 MAG: DUF2784 domain-containing protein [Planctomycetota bacterium]REK21424.1 MAG: DUF2784 domain-containing protein [Planctomycetota bacterium]REK40064.1 MAG: DUF2784 domain-containing protein [Planctomycetota bacterium]
MELFYRILADIVVVIHAAYVLFVIVALPLILAGWFCEWQWVRNPWFRFVHLAMILIVVVQALLGIMCPLTVWEQDLRELAGQETYRGAFIANIAHDLLFYEGPAWVFTVCYCAFGLAVLAAFLLAPPRFGRRDDGVKPEPPVDRDASPA